MKQDLISQEMLNEHLYQEFIYRANEVGVDINQALAHNHVSSLIQFICGLGARKGEALLRVSVLNNINTGQQNAANFEINIKTVIFFWDE